MCVTTLIGGAFVDFEGGGFVTYSVGTSYPSMVLITKFPILSIIYTKLPTSTSTEPPCEIGIPFIVNEKKS